VAEHAALVFDKGKGRSTQKQRYDDTAMFTAVRKRVDLGLILPNTNDWKVTPETARLLQYWHHNKVGSIRPFFRQVEAVETQSWLIAVAS
jgi:type III restriction enzyme